MREGLREGARTGIDRRRPAPACSAALRFGHVPLVLRPGTLTRLCRRGRSVPQRRLWQCRGCSGPPSARPLPGDSGREGDRDGRCPSPVPLPVPVSVSQGPRYLPKGQSLTPVIDGTCRCRRCHETFPPVTRGQFPNRAVTIESLFRERLPAPAGLAEGSGEVRQPGTAEGPGADLPALHPKASTAELGDVRPAGTARLAGSHREQSVCSFVTSKSGTVSLGSIALLWLLA